jgi:hypothetical protein
VSPGACDVADVGDISGSPRRPIFLQRRRRPVDIAAASRIVPPTMIHENLARSIQELGARMQNIRDSL